METSKNGKIEKPFKGTTDLAFQPSLDSVARISTPTDFIISGFLRASKTFSIYQAAYAELGVEGSYRPLEIERVGGDPNRVLFHRYLDVIRGNSAIRSIVISDPYKQLAAATCDELDSRATLCGAVNLILARDGKLMGLNVDGEAFYKGLLRSHPGVSMRDAVILGCGGVSTAVATFLAPSLSSVKLVDIDPARGQILSERLKGINTALDITVCRRPGTIDFSKCDFMYNGSGLGKMSSDPGSVLKTPLETTDNLPRAGIAVDANYTPETTPFLAELGARGLTLENGRSHMLAFVSIHIGKLLGREISVDAIEKV